jgi:hypothetical protein
VLYTSLRALQASTVALKFVDRSTSEDGSAVATVARNSVDRTENFMIYLALYENGVRNGDSMENHLLRKEGEAP